MTDAEKAVKLREAINLLMDADSLVQEVLGNDPVCYETHTRIQDLVDDLQSDVMELEPQ
jgi:ABC-type oligopeptide transport system substrate-binding subunit